MSEEKAYAIAKCLARHMVYPSTFSIVGLMKYHFRYDNSVYKFFNLYEIYEVFIDEFGYFTVIRGEEEGVTYTYQLNCDKSLKRDIDIMCGCKGNEEDISNNIKAMMRLSVELFGI